MTEVNPNTNSYYTTCAKVEKRPKTVVAPPVNLPCNNLTTSKTADLKLKNINQEIYTSTKLNQKSSVKTFIKYFLLSIAGLLCLRCGRKIFKR